METFSDLDVQAEIIRGLKERGIEVPFPIQREAIPPLLAGLDVIGQAKTGTGKTAAFGLPLIARTQTELNKVQALVLAPTRELVVQVAQDLKAYARYTKVRVTAIYGGVSLGPQIDALRMGVHIVVGTPGRVLDLLHRRSLQLGDVRMLVLDEADRMLDMGFIEDVERIIRATPKSRQTALFGATMPPEIRTLGERHMTRPTRILIDEDELSVESIRQYYRVVDREEKVEGLCKVLTDEKVGRAIVFCRTKRETLWLSRNLQRRRFSVTTINGDLSQNQRDRAMHAFRRGERRLLIATDLAQRGLDIDGVTHIINFHVPEDPHAYFHRIGRTGRAGRAGTAITLVTPWEKEDFRRIQATTSAEISPLP